MAGFGGCRGNGTVFRWNRLVLRIHNVACCASVGKGFGDKVFCMAGHGGYAYRYGAVSGWACRYEGTIFKPD